MPSEALKQQTTRRLRILWIVLGALLLVSVTPLWLYHRQVLRLSEEKLQDTERVQQIRNHAFPRQRNAAVRAKSPRTTSEPAPGARAHRLD